MLKKDYEKVKRKKQLLIFALAVLTIVCAYIFTTIGIAKAGIDQTFIAVQRFFDGTINVGSDVAINKIILLLRMPRILLAILAGVGLAVSGAVMQSVTRNYLVSPFTLGISSAAAFGASVCIVFGTGMFFHSELGMIVCAFAAYLEKKLCLFMRQSFFGLIHPFLSPEKQSNRARSGVAADGGSDVVDLDFSVQIGKAFLDKIRNGPRIFVAGGLGNVAFAGVGEAALGVFFHLIDDFFDDFFLRTDFKPRNQPSFVVHVEQRADAEEAADCAGGFGDAAAAHVEGEVRGEEPVMDFEAVFHRKIVNLFQRFSFIAQVGKAVHQKTIAGGSAEGIHDEDFPFRVALFKVGFGDHRRIQDTGNAGGEANVENVFAVLQECFKIGFKFIGIHLGCFRGSAGGHGGIELIERHGLAEIVRVLGVI